MTYKLQSHFADRITNLLEYRAALGRSIREYKCKPNFQYRIVKFPLLFNQLLE